MSRVVNAIECKCEYGCLQVLENSNIINEAASVYVEDAVRLPVSRLTRIVKAEDFFCQKFATLLPMFSQEMIRSFVNHSSVLRDLTNIVDHDTYWKTAFLPDKNTLFNEDHMRQIIRVLENFEKYLEKLKLATLNMKQNLLVSLSFGLRQCCQLLT